MRGVTIKRAIWIVAAIGFLIAGWFMTGFYVVTDRKTDLYEPIGDKLRTTSSIGGGTYLRAARRSEYAKFAGRARTVSAHELAPEYFSENTRQLAAYAPYLTVGFMGRY